MPCLQSVDEIENAIVQEEAHLSNLLVELQVQEEAEQDISVLCNLAYLVESRIILLHKERRKCLRLLSDGRYACEANPGRRTTSGIARLPPRLW
jgi:hypothetical protein